MSEEKIKKIIVAGKRKTSLAKAIIVAGKGEISLNKRKLQTLELFERLKIEEPLRIADKILGERKFNVEIKMRGGGAKSQIEAARLALAKAIVEFSKSKELREAYLAYDRNMLVADVRRKEAYKPGDSKARSKRQSSKR